MYSMADSKLSNESVVIRSLRNIRNRLFINARMRPNEQTATHLDEGASLVFLDALPVDMQFLIMTFLSPQDLCRLGGTSRYWRLVVRDPHLWKYLLLRDMPLWQSVDHISMPRLESLDTPLFESSEFHGQDFMADYLKGSPACRCQWQQPRAAYEVVASFLQSLVVSTEPRFAMFGPGLEQLEVSLMTRMMHSPDVLLVAGTPQRQINGIGSGISFEYNNQHKFNILTLYSTNRTERERARVEQQSVRNKLFIQEDGQSGLLRYSLATHVQEVCQAVNGFIFVANAEAGRGDGKEQEWAQIRAMLDPAWGPTSRPILVLSCVSREGPDRARTPCVNMAQQLNLRLLPNPWMVRDTVAESLSGLLDGIVWLLRHSGLRV